MKLAYTLRLPWKQSQTRCADDYEIQIGTLWMRIFQECETQWTFQTEDGQSFHESLWKAEQTAIYHAKDRAEQHADELAMLSNVLETLPASVRDDYQIDSAPVVLSVALARLEIGT